MADHVWTVLCQKTLADPSSGVISLFEITEKLILHPGKEIDDVCQGLEKIRSTGQKGVLVPVRLQLVSWWVRSEFSKAETAEIRLAFLSPSGERLFQQTVPMEMTENTGQRLTLNFDVLPVTSLGRSYFIVEQPKVSKGKALRWVTVARVPLELEGEPAQSR